MQTFYRSTISTGSRPMKDLPNLVVCDRRRKTDQSAFGCYTRMPSSGVAALLLNATGTHSVFQSVLSQAKST